MPDHELPDLGLRFTARREALVLCAYEDGKHLSIGFGDNDPSLKPGDTITVAEAFKRLKKAVKPRVKDLNRWLKVQLEPHQFSAIFSMYYQSGGNFLRKEGLIDLINAGHSWQAIDRFPEFDTKQDGKGGIVHDVNLRRRRLLEQKLWRTGDYGSLSPIPIWRHGYPGPFEWYHVQPGDFDVA